MMTLIGHLDKARGLTAYQHGSERAECLQATRSVAYRVGMGLGRGRLDSQATRSVAYRVGVWAGWTGGVLGGTKKATPYIAVRGGLL